MANETTDSLLDKAKFFREHVQTILSLATGAFVLSVTFLHDITPKAQQVDYLRKSWAIFVCTILLGLAYNYVLSIYEDGRALWRAQRDVKNRTLLGDIDLLPVEHGIDPLAKAGFFRELKEKPQRFIGDAVF